jgi:(p)ppGpp synthase/HD superfamily hydrolase
VVEILTAKNKKLPSSDWLKFVKTQSARSQIRKALRISQK